MFVCFFLRSDHISMAQDVFFENFFEEVRVDLHFSLVPTPFPLSHDLISQSFKITSTSAGAVSTMYCNRCYDEKSRYGWKAMSSVIRSWVGRDAAKGHRDWAHTAISGVQSDRLSGERTEVRYSSLPPSAMAVELISRWWAQLHPHLAWASVMRTISIEGCQ